MKVREFVTLIHNSFTQQGSTLLLSSCEIVGFINLAFQDIIQYGDGTWSFLRWQEKVMSSKIPEKQYLELESFFVPGGVANITKIYDHYTCEFVEPLKACNIDIKKMDDCQKGKDLTWHVYYNPYELTTKEINGKQVQGTYISLPNNNDPRDNKVYGYTIWYDKPPDGIKLTCPVGKDDEMPIPDRFIYALYDFTMSYASFPYGQSGESHENYFYGRGQAKLQKLRLVDNNIPTTSLSFNIN